MGRWSISEFSTFRWSLEEEIANYRNYGFDAIGIWNQKLEDHDPDECEDWLFNSQLQISSYSWIGGFTGSEGVSHLDAVKNAKQCIRRASRIGANTVIVYPGSRERHTANHSKRCLADALKVLIPCAIDYGVRLALEPMDKAHSGQWSVFNSPEETLEFVNAFDSRGLGVVLDLYHVGFNQTVFESLKQLGKRIALVQLSDRSITSQGSTNQFDQPRLLLNAGDVPTLEWINRLEESGYEGFYELEVFGPNLEFNDYEERLSQTRDTLAQFTALIHAS